MTTADLDYSLYPGYFDSMGFSQRGRRLRCRFCVVPRKEGSVSDERSITDIWRCGTVDTKARYGLPWFEERWASLQLRLF